MFFLSFFFKIRLVVQFCRNLDMILQKEVLHATLHSHSAGFIGLGIVVVLVFDFLAMVLMLRPAKIWKIFGKAT